MPDSDGNFAAVVVGKLSFAQVLGDELSKHE
ncbi:bac9ce68-a30c-4072-9cce-f18645d446ff [Thermothielavioides terrestris]|uniref:Bac9ce68-a30c-4072-9cce-f18645d446ff n=1 Tax=Thermothielavioides terrestris TaxID=2587410 RepID=A0A3S4BHG8_9PEZI|nr:bac9ce68-a30c-4072-9cce-f18645d446ff [Thermothielavioides terrestris]